MKIIGKPVLLVSVAICLALGCAVVSWTPVHAQATTGIVRGIAYYDRNRNGRLDGGDSPLAGAGIVLSILGQSASEVYRFTTGTNGVFEFHDVVPGQYMLWDRYPPPGYLGVSLAFRMTADLTIEFDLAHYLAPTATPTPTTTATPTPTATPTAVATPTETATPAAGVIAGKVYNDRAAPGQEVSRAFIEACAAGGGCQTTTSDSGGAYQFTSLAAGQYRLRAFPPGGNHRLSGLLGPLMLPENATLSGQDILLLPATGLPAGTTLTPILRTLNGVPTVHWQDALTLTTTGCSAGVATYRVYQNGPVIRSGDLHESPAGIYTGKIAPLYPFHNDAHVVITLQCPGGDSSDVAFDIYIDPSGEVVNTHGGPIPDAIVTLYRADAASGPFAVVTSGSAIMSPGNRENPMRTDSAGRFGWDVIAGYYRVRAEKAGCVAGDDRGQVYAQTDVLTIPPPVTDLRLELYCGEPPANRIYLPLMMYSLLLRAAGRSPG